MGAKPDQPLLRRRSAEPFSCLQEKVAGDSWPDEGLRRDSIESPPAFDGPAHGPCADTYYYVAENG
jgi:hypothetical protein